ncbi:MAG: hypothetical protein JNG86_00220, partial [Verrucomicrobiaceae bacterium]|nr:hypothetical protein [Verrucomicrobiaceae bacterium]
MHLFILLLALCPQLPAQAPRTLAEMEAIYQRELSQLHIPLISRYLIELQRQAAAAPDKTAWQSEIIRVQQLLKTGGVIDLAAARAALDNVAAPMPPPSSPPLARQITGAALVLTPALTLNVAAPPPDTLPVGQIEWRVEFLAAGTYDIHLQYACPALPADLPLRIEFGGQTVETTLGPAHVTRDSTTFRVHRLGRITLLAD